MALSHHFSSPLHLISLKALQTSMTIHTQSTNANNCHQPQMGISLPPMFVSNEGR